MPTEIFEKPRFTAATPEGQLAELRLWAYKLVEQLNWAFNALPGVGTEAHDRESGITARR